jgi:hypothetical protein
MSINEIDRDRVIAKYGIDQPPQADNPIVESVLDIERTIARITRKAGDNSWMFDPIWNPTMHELADRVMGEVRSRFGSRIAKAPDGAAFLYYPGEPNRFRVFSRGIERFSYLLTCRWHDGCDIGLAPGGCSEGTVFLPLQRGQFLIVFEICGSCDECAGQTAQDNYILSEMEARGRVGLPLV